MIRADSVHSTPPLNTSALTPIAGLDWLDIAADAKPADIFRAIEKLRKEAREEIDRLIRFLDKTENHMCVDDEDGGDAEPDTHDEPSLGFLEITNQERIAQGGTDQVVYRSRARHLRRRALAWQHGRAASQSGAMGSGNRRDLQLDDGDAGIADHDGLLEQMGRQDWQSGVMA